MANAKVKDLKELESRVADMATKFSEMKESFDFLSNENSELKLQVKALQKQIELTNGLVTKAQTKIISQNEKILDLQTRSMRDNIVIQGISEGDRESWADTEKKVLEFMKKELKINNASEEMIDRAHRIGTKINNKPRGIVVKFASSKFKDTIFQHVKHLHGKDYIVQEQFPPEISERRKRLWPIFKAAKEQKKTDKTVRVNWSLDKLMVNGVTHQAKDDRRIICPDDTFHLANIKQTPKVIEGKSTFQGHASKLTDGTTVDAVLAKLLSNGSIASAHHHIYAYRYGNTEGRCDDDEHGASAKLLKLLKDQDVTDSIVIVTRWFGGVHIGPKRFTLIENCASDALKILT